MLVKEVSDISKLRFAMGEPIMIIRLNGLYAVCLATGCCLIHDTGFADVPFIYGNNGHKHCQFDAI